ncbi:BolA/IbaG family iron-sulfur metabolism protein [Candidatus Gillettellia adelgis]
MIREQMLVKLTKAFQPTYLNVINESYRHNSSSGLESHFKVVLVSNDFIGTSFLTRHRSIYSVLSEELVNGVYALALHIYTLKEFKNKQDKSLVSPYCLGATD